MEQIINMLADPKVRTIAGLILLDVVLGIAEAIKLDVFDWKRVGEFYQTMVLPMLLGFTAVTFLTPLLVGELLGEYSKLLGDGLVTIAWIALVAQLGTSILRHARSLWEQLPEL